MKIQFFSEDLIFKLQQKQVITEWLEKIIENHHYSINQLNYIFCSDKYLLQINQDYLNHDCYTDIITFDNSEDTDVIESDIFISIERVKENATNQSILFELELHRVMVHGVLHLLGFNDKEEDDKRRMREKEDACLSLLKK